MVIDRAEEPSGWSRLLLDSMGEAIFVGDRSGAILDVNRAGLERLRCTRDELLSVRAFDVVPDLAPEEYSVVMALIAAGTPVTRRQVHRRRDGVVYGCEVQVRQFLSGQEPLVLVSERTILGEPEPEVADGPWQADAVVAVDRAGHVVMFSDGAQRVFQIARTAVIGRSFEPFCTLPLTSAILEQVDERAVRRVPAPSPVSAVARRASGERFPAEVMLRHLEAGGLPLVAILVRDLAQGSLPSEVSALATWSAAEPPGLAAMVGRSAAMTRLRAFVRTAAAASATVLVTGETGTGKELVASALHELSPRRAGPFVRVNSAALPPGLIDSELFGHERGAFTDAVARNIGRFEAAHGGTLFLDEIGDLPLELQAKLLRVLQERRITRLGGGRPIEVDVRVIAATNRDLRRAVAEGRFRADLYYRLNVLPVVVPPLRERREDIPDLVRHFVREIGALYGRTASPFDARALSLMEAYDWPGNVRELHNLVERAVILATDRELAIEEWWESSVPSSAANDPRQLERERILAALERTGWRVTGAHGCARLLGLKASTLFSRMKKLGIRRPRA